MMTAMLALGAIALAWAAGDLALGATPFGSASRLARPAATLAVGAALVTPILVLLAAFHLFEPVWLGAAGWILLALRFAMSRRGSWRARTLDRADVAIAATALLFVAFAGHGRDEVLGGGRDEQVYAQFGIHLARHGSFDLLYSPVDSADAALLEHGSSVEACTATLLDRGTRQPLATTTFVVPGATNACDGVRHPLTLLHPWGWPAWLGIAYAVGGTEGVYRANSVVFALGGILLFALLRRLVALPIAVAATILFLALPSSLWIGGVALSEPLTMVLLLAVPVVAFARPLRAAPVLAALGLAATLIRADGALIFPVLMAAACVASFAHPTNPFRSQLRSVFPWSWGAMSAAAAFYVVLMPSYTDTFLWSFAQIFGAMALVTALFFLPAGAREHLDRVAANRRVQYLVIALLGVAVAWAAFVRPYWPGVGSPLAGIRDYREESLRNLATYLSWPVVMAAVAGCALAILQQWPRRRAWTYALLLILGIGPAVLYLARPYVSPDHPWSFRRFVPLVVPLTLLFAAVALDRLARRFGPLGTRVGAVGIVAVAPALLVAHSAKVVIFPENDGLTRALTTMVDALPHAVVVSTVGDHDIEAVAFVAFDRPVAALDVALGRGGDALLSDWFHAKARLGHPAWLLHASALPRAGLRFTTVGDWWLTRTYTRPTVRPPARDLSTESVHVLLSRIDGRDPAFASQMFGAEKAWDVPESGFFASEIASFGTFRYTNGNAWIEVPSSALAEAEALKVDVYTYAKPGVRKRAYVTIDGQAMWGGLLESGVSTLRVPVPAASRGPTVRIGLVSEAADPADLGPGDPRIGLSAGLIGIRPLKDGEPAMPDLAMAGFRSELVFTDVPPGGLHLRVGEDGAAAVDVRNAGSAYWPTYREKQDSAGIVQFALRWYRTDDPDRPVGDNRWPMEVSLLPGDRTVVRLPLQPVGVGGVRLPPGRYEVRIGMVREGVSLFVDHGDARLSLPIEISP